MIYEFAMDTLADIGHYLAFMGEFERGVELSRRAQELNPLHPGWYYFSFARLDYNRKAYDGTIRWVEKSDYPTSTGRICSTQLPKVN